MHKVSVVLGIRPDFIRTSKVLRLLKEHPDVEATLIHTGQHYDRNLNGVFFEQLNVPRPDVQLNTRGATHCEQHSKLISGLGSILSQIKPDVCLFLGDANATIGCIAPLKMGIPIAHIEAGMRSYNWKMPEERNRVLIDRVSDILYVYQHDYKINLVKEGVDPTKIEVVGNVIVDVIEEHMDKVWWPSKKTPDFMSVHPPMENLTLSVGGVELERKKFALMTLHRGEHMNDPELAQSIIDQVGASSEELGVPVVLIEMPRLKSLELRYPDNFIVIPPLGFFEFVRLEKGAMIEFTDSGTNQEVSAILRTPCVVTREATERPETFDSGITFMANPANGNIADAALFALQGTYNEDFSLGDGRSSERIVNNLVARLDKKMVYFDRIELGPNSPLYDAFKAKHFKVV